MYNGKQKNKFIQQYSSNKSTERLCVKFFDSTQPYEEELNADICTLESEQIQSILDHTATGVRAGSRLAKIVILRDYIRWCMENNYPNVNHNVNNITTNGVEKVRRRTVANPKALQMYLDEVFDSESNMTTDNIYRCYFWLAYAGMSEEDIFKVKISDVDFRRMAVRYDRRNTEVPIYPEALEAFHNCVELDYFKYQHPGYSEIITKPRVAGDTLIRGTVRQIALLSMRSVLSKRTKSVEDEVNKRLSYFGAWISGVFYRAREYETAGLVPIFDDVVEQRMEGKDYKLSDGRTIDSKKREYAKQYMNDYRLWKIAWWI